MFPEAADPSLVRSIEIRVLHRYVDGVALLESNEFCVDIHMEHLLVFSARADLHANALYVSGHVIIQDKVRDNYEGFEEHLLLVIVQSLL